MNFRDLLKKTSVYLSTKAKEAQSWYRERIAGLSGGQPPPAPPEPPKKDFFKKSPLPEIGKMYIYYYDPKWKHKLPYYDQYPLTIPIDYYNDGFLGLNLHYLPPGARITLLQVLYDLLNNQDYNDQTKLNISYGILKTYSSKYAGFENCVKRYLYGHVRSSFHEINPSDWEKVALLPLQRWITNPNRRFSARPPY